MREAGTKPKRSRVFVGLSGGVDSSVAAALLREEGYEVTGVFIKGWHPPFLPCTWQDDRRDAMRVAATLDIPFVTLDLSREYKRDVADYLIREYEAGRTPNPDVMCNRAIKFGAFFDWALAQGADFIATGHYAQNQSSGSYSRLLAAKDSEKDQTYFLWAIPQERLARLLFPIGKYKKNDVRRLAERFSLPTAYKKDSQGVCFLGQLNMKDFLSLHIKTNVGTVLDPSGKVVGVHNGATLYTLGQRHGFVTAKTSSQETPHYVVGKDIAANTLTVAPSPHALAQKGGEVVRISECNWLGEPPPSSGFRCNGRYRYRQPYIPMTLTLVKGQTATVQIPEGLAPPARGQSLVLYDSDRCLGGGVVV